MTLPPARHDALFRLLVSDPARAGHILRECLPAELLDLLDPDHPPEHVEGTAIDAEGRRTQADAIFRIRLKGGGRALVYALLEHKARPDPLTPLQLLRYMVRLWTMETDGGGSAGRLPLIIPVVFYHGREPWRAPLSVQEMIDAPEGLERLARSFGSYTLRDLGRTAPGKLSLDVRVRSGFMALMLSNRESAGDDEDDMLVAGIADDELGSYTLAYIIEQVSLPPERIEAALRRTGKDPYEVEDIMGTAAQIWKEQGRQEGLAEGKASAQIWKEQGRQEGLAEGKASAQIWKEQGRAEGKAETFLRQARIKFGSVPPARAEKVRAAAAGELDAWLEALITAEDIEAVFGARRGH